MNLDYNAVKYLILLFILVASGSATDLRRPVSVHLTSEMGDREDYLRVVRAFLVPNSLGLSTQKDIEEGMGLLKSSPYFQSVDTISSGSVLKVVLEPSPILKNVRFRGKGFLFRDDLLSVMSVRSGQYLSDNLKNQQVNLIRKRLMDFGYQEPIVEVFADLDIVDGTVDLLFTIDKESIYAMGQIIYEGNSARRDFSLSFMSKLWRSSFGGYVYDDIEAGVKRLQQYYFSQGFYECEIEIEPKIDHDMRAVDVIIRIDEGPRYRFNYGSLRPFRRREVRRAFDLSSQGNRNDFTLRRRAFSLQRQLWSQGYAQARVTYESDTSYGRRYNRRIVTIEVDSSDRVPVKSITFTGNSSLRDSYLRSYMLTVEHPMRKNGAGTYVPSVLREDVENLYDLYNENGFRDVHIDYHVDGGRIGDSAVISISITEGGRTQISEIELLGLEESFRDSLLIEIPLQIGAPYYRGDIIETEFFIRNRLRRSGYPYGVVEKDLQFSDDSSTVKVEFIIDPGTMVYVGDIFFSGNFKTRDSYLKRRFGIKSGDPYSPQDVYAGVRRLRNIEAIQNVTFSIPELPLEREEVNLFFSFEERIPYILNFALGYEEEHLFYGNIRAQNRNLFGLNKQLELGGFVNLLGEWIVGLTYTEPNLFNRPIRASTTVAAQHRKQEGEAEDYTEIYNSYRLNWLISRRINTFAAIAFYARDIQNMDSVRTSIETTPGVSFDTRDSFLRPKKGVYLRTDMNLSIGISHDEDNFIRNNYESKAFVSPFNRLTLGTRLGGSIVNVYGGADSVKADQKLTLGGRSSVRGYEEGMLFIQERDDGKLVPLGGYGAISGSVEIRIELPANLEVTLFADGGTLLLSSESSSYEPLRISYGGGLRYVTMIGSIGLLYGKKHYDNLSDIAEAYARSNPYALHFSINYTF